jgi:hypothetical protein
MTRAPQPGTTPARRQRGFEPACGLVSDRVRSGGEKRGFAVSRLLTHWAEIAGEELARVTRPVKIGYARDGFGATLTLLTTSAQAPVVQMQLPKLRERVNACYGYNAISRILLTQTAPTGFAEGQAEFAPAPKPVAAPDPATVAESKAAAQGVADDGLRTAIETITRNFLMRTKAT